MQVKWLDEAVRDLIELRKYIARDNPSAASNRKYFCLVIPSPSVI
jgi:plasmid stabilization system protein ParE